MSDPLIGYCWDGARGGRLEVKNIFKKEGKTFYSVFCKRCCQEKEASGSNIRRHEVGCLCKEQVPSKTAEKFIGTFHPNNGGGVWEVLSWHAPNPRAMYTVKCMHCSVVNKGKKDRITNGSLQCGCDLNIGKEYQCANGNIITLKEYEVYGRGNTKRYISTCSVCSLDEELWPYGTIKTTLPILNRGVIPCGCSSAVHYSREQKKIIIKRLGALHGYSLEYLPKGLVKRASKIGLSCEIHGVWHTATFDTIMNGSGCPKCALTFSEWGLCRNKLDSPDNLYLLRFKCDTEVFYKVGRTFNPEARIKVFKRTGYDVDIIKIIHGTHENVFFTEKSVHTNPTIAGFKATPSMVFGGHCECYDERLLYHPLINNIFEL